jgi:hypothetical protein
MIRLSLGIALLCASLLPAQTQVCSTTLAGPGCGSTLTITFPVVGNHHMVQLDAAGLYPSELGAMLWGIDQVTPWPVIPGSPCLIYTTPIWSHLFMTNPDGTTSIQRAWPLSYQGYFYMQMGGLHVLPSGGFDVTVTNCEIAECHQQ